MRLSEPCTSVKSEILDIVNNIDYHKCIEHPNILIAARLWDDERYYAAKVCYKFMRKIDDLIDDKKSECKEFSDEEKKVLTSEVNHWINNLNGNTIDPDLAEINKVIARFKIPVQLFHTFARSMIFDINNTGFKSIEQFIEYAEGASVAPASVFVHLCCLNDSNGIYTPHDFDLLAAARPCAIFSYLVHIIRDFQKDQLCNLNYFALDILERNNLTPSQLQKMAKERNVNEDFRNVIREYCYLAEIYKLKTFSVINELMADLNPRYLLSLFVIFNLYQQVYERIDIDNGTFMAAELNPKPEEVRSKVLEVIEAFEGF